MRPIIAKTMVYRPLSELKEILTPEDLNLADTKGDTLLHFAAKENRIEYLEYLLAQPNIGLGIENKHGYTALHEAKRRNFTKAATMIENMIIKLAGQGALDAINTQFKNTNPQDAAIIAGFGALKNIRGKAPLLEGALLTAVMHDDADALANALDSKHRVDMKIETSLGDNILTYETLLYIASHHGKVNVIKKLLELGADPNLQARNGWSPLFIASRQGHLEVVEVLIKAGADVTFKNKNDMSCLNIAAYGGHLNIVKQLLLNGANVTQYDKMGAGPLSAAVQTYGNKPEGKLKIAQEELKAMSKEEIKRQYEEKFGITYDKALETIHENALELVECLMSYGADVNACTISDQSPLYVAAMHGFDKAVELFLRNDAANRYKMNAAGLTPLTVAAFHGELGVIKLLLGDLTLDESTRYLNDYTKGQNVTAAYAAAQNGHLEVLKYVVKRGANIRQVRDNGNTVLHAATIKNRVEVLEYLLPEFAALIDVLNIDGASALYMAAETGNLASLEILVKYGASVNVKNKHGFSPLHIAAQNGHFDVVKALIKLGIGNINQIDSDGRTALWWAAKSEKASPDIIKMLIVAGADPTIADKEGVTPFEEANKLNNRDKANILKSAINDKMDVDGGGGYIAAQARLFQLTPPPTSTVTHLDPGFEADTKP